MSAQRTPGEGQGDLGSGRDEQDHRLEVAMGHLLRTGVTLAAAVVLAGGMLYLSHPAAPVPGYRSFNASSAHPIAPGPLLRSAARGESRSLMFAGILLLIATPVARVIFALLGFMRERDWLYTAVSAAVLAILAASLIYNR